MSKKNKRPPVNETENEQKETVLSEELGDKEEAENNMDEIIEDIITEEPSADIPAEEADVSDSADISAEETVSAEETPAAAESVPEPESTPAVQADGNTAGTIMRPVNFRTGPSFSKASTAELKPGTKVKVTGSAEGERGTWYECEFDGRKGYVKATGVTIKG